jgi:hypothetical protein
MKESWPILRYLYWHLPGRTEGKHRQDVSMAGVAEIQTVYLPNTSQRDYCCSSLPSVFVTHIKRLDVYVRNVAAVLKYKTQDSTEVKDRLHISKNSHEQDLFWNLSCQAVIHYLL